MQQVVFVSKEFLRITRHFVNQLIIFFRIQAGQFDIWCDFINLELIYRGKKGENGVKNISNSY